MRILLEPSLFDISATLKLHIQIGGPPSVVIEDAAERIYPSVFFLGHDDSIANIRYAGALAETKKKAVQVRDKLVAAGDMREGIDEKREQYRPVATRGAVMYFTVVDLSLVNVMYQTSLDQFRVLFDRYVEGPGGVA